MPAIARRIVAQSRRERPLIVTLGGKIVGPLKVSGPSLFLSKLRGPKLGPLLCWDGRGRWLGEPDLVNRRHSQRSRQHPVRMLVVETTVSPGNRCKGDNFEGDRSRHLGRQPLVNATLAADAIPANPGR